MSNNDGLTRISPNVAGYTAIDSYMPIFWFQWGNYIEVEPRISTSDYSVRAFIADAPSAALTGTTSVPSELPAEFQTLLVDFACYVLSLKLKKWKQAARYYNKYINDLSKKRRDFLLRKAEKKSIRELPDNINSAIGKEVDEKKRRVLPDQVVYSDGRPWQH